MKKCYFIIHGIKFIFIYDNGKRKILKEENGQLLPLSLEEQEVIDKIFTYDNGYIYYMSKRLDKIILDNDKLDADLHVYKLLGWLEKLIPEDCRENFYRNLSTLQIHQNLDAINDEQVDEYRGGDASYDFRTNTITVYRNYISWLWKLAQELAQEINNPQDFFEKEYYVVLLHEMTHMASTKYDPETEICHCGFDTFSDIEFNDRNVGLTEGMTEIVAMAGVPGTLEITSGYYIEALLVNQIILTIGIEEVIRSYFSAAGVDGIKHKLSEFGLSDSEASYLLNLIECNFMVRKTQSTDYSTNALSEIQSTLLNCFEVKCNREINSPGFDRKKLESLFSSYESMLVNPSVLKLKGLNSNHYTGLEENMEKFYSLRNKYLPELDIEKSREVKEVTEQSNFFDSQQSMEEYRKNLRNTYLTEKDNDTVIRSSFRVTNGDNPQCEHIVERINQDKKDILFQKTFDYNEDFRKQVLTQFIIDYAQCSSIMGSEVKGHSDSFSNESLTVDYQAISENNNILSISNIESKYAAEIASTIEKVHPTIYEQYQFQQKMQQERGGLLPANSSSIKGFVSTIILTVIVGIICFLFILLGVLILA